MPTSLTCGPGELALVVAESDGRSCPRVRMTAPEPSQPQAPEERERADALLVERMARGERAALGQLYDRFSGPLYGTALRVLRDPSEAQDVMHDTFLTLWDKAGTFDPSRGGAFAWAVSVVRNRAIDRVRMRRRRAELLEAGPADASYGENLSASSGSDAAMAGDQAQAIRAAVAKLPLEQQRAIELAFFSGLTQEEIAGKLAEPLGTVKARIRRGLLKLRDSLAMRL